MKENHKIELGTIGINKIENIGSYDKYIQKTPLEESAKDEDMYIAFNDAFDVVSKSADVNKVAALVDKIIDKSKINPENTRAQYFNSKAYLDRLLKNYGDLIYQKKFKKGIELIKLQNQIQDTERRIDLAKDLLKYLRNDLPKEDKLNEEEEDLSVSESRFGLN